MDKIKNIFSNVTQKVSSTLNQLKQINLNPINIFIKDSLDKIFDDLTLGHQIKLQDIRKGSVSLQNLLLNSQKINKQHLFSSPYILHNGSISRLRIQLPSLLQLQTTSITLQIEEIFLQLKPQSNFAENFKNIIQEIKQYIRLNGAEDDMQEDSMACEHDPRDYFKKLIKTMFRNLKVRVKNIVILIYLQDPQKTKISKEKNEMFMLRIPLINVHRGGEIQIGDQSQNHKLQTVNFDIQLPQFTLHLLHDESQKQKQNFPFRYPTLNHPGTILLFGQESFIQSEIQKDQYIPRAMIEIKTDYVKGQKEYNLTIQATKIEAMINPQQIKILLFFIAQIKHFGEQLSKVKKQLGYGENTQKIDQSSLKSLVLLNRKSSNKKINEDLFGTMCMSFWESGTFMLPVVSHGSKRRTSDMIDSIIDQRPQLRAEVQELNRELQKSLYHSLKQGQSQIMEQKHIVAISFRNFVTFNMKLGLIQLYIVKNLGSQHQKRSWTQNTCKSLDRQINCEIKQSYFLFSLVKTNFLLKQREKQIQLQLEQILVRHVKYTGKEKKQNIRKQSCPESKQKQQVIKNIQSMSGRMSQDQQFFDVQGSMDYYQQQQRQRQKEKERQNKQKYYQEKGIHHCSQNIVRISHKKLVYNSHQHNKDSNKIYSFHPNLSQQKQEKIQTYEPGVLMRKKQTQKQNKLLLKLMYVEVSVGTQIGLEIVQFSSLVKEILQNNKQKDIMKNNNSELKSNTIGDNNQQNNQKNNQQNIKSNNNNQLIINEKQTQINNQSFIKSIPTSYQITTNSISITFYESPIENFKSSVQKYQLNQPYQTQSSCFCYQNTKGIYLLISQLKLLNQQHNTKMTLKKLNLCIININQSHIIQTSSFLSITQHLDIQNNKKQKLKLLYQTNKKHKPKAQRLILKLPQIHINIQQNDIINSLEIIKRQTQIFLSKIRKLLTVQSNNNFKKQTQKKGPILNSKQYSNNEIQIQISLIRIRFIDLELYLRNLTLQKKTEQLFISLSTIVVSSIIPTKVFHTIMKKAGIPQYSQFKQDKQDNKNKSRYPQINDSLILLQINNPEYCPKTNQHQQKSIKKRHQKPLSFNSDQIFLERQSCLALKIKTQGIPNTQITKKFISVSLFSPICINAVNSIKTYHKINIYQEFLNKVNNTIENISNKLIISQGNFHKKQKKQFSIQQVSYSYCQQVNVTGGKLFIDIHPTFVSRLPKDKIKVGQNQQNPMNQLIFSNTRSILELQWDELKIGNFSNDSQRYSSATLTIKYYFTKIIQENTLNSRYYKKSIGQLSQSLQDLQNNNKFIKVLQVKKIKIKIQRIAHLIRPNIAIDDIKIQSTFQNLSWLILHWQHFIKHDLNKDYGITIDENQNIVQELKWDQNQQQNLQQNQQIQDITFGSQIYNQKIQYKKQVQQNFIKKKPFLQPKVDKQCSLFLQNLSIQHISIKLSYNKISHLETYLEEIKIVTNLHQQTKKTQMFLKMQQFQINYFQKHQQPQGILGMVVNFWYKTQDQCFQILKTNNIFKLLLQIDQKNVMLKTDKVNFQIGFTSELLKLIDQWDRIELQVKNSGWKKIYQSENVQPKEQKNQRFLLIHGPQTTLRLTLVYEGLNILSSKRLDTPIFLLHQQTQQSDQIKSYVINWVESLIKYNIKGLIAASALDSFGSLVNQLLRLVKVVVSMFLRCFA